MKDKTSEEKQVEKIDKFLSKEMRKTKNKEIEELCKKLLNCLDSNYYEPKGIMVVRRWSFFNFSVDDID